MTELVNIPADDWTLHGIVHLPEQSSGTRVGVLVYHENYNTKFGTHHLFRNLADRLASAGFYVLRYDDRGMCDSPGICDLTIADRLADAKAAAKFFRTVYKLDIVIGWGLCLGAALAVHTSASPDPQEQLDGLILCSIVADPGIVSLPQFGYERVEVSKLAQDFFLRGNVFRKLLNAPRSFRSWMQKLGVIVRRHLQGTPKELGRMKATIGRVGGLLAAYDGSCLMIFGEKDSYLTDFTERVNPGDKLKLKEKRNPPEWVLIEDGDHTFSSREKTEQLFQATLNWLERLPGREQGAVADIAGNLQAGNLQTEQPSAAAD
jgi:pimeloyl-ACP methyl ester carboxylesterase